jgi:hypothetical protein
MTLEIFQQTLNIYRRVRIDIEPVQRGMSVTVYLKTTTTGNFINILGPLDVIQTTNDCPTLNSVVINTIIANNINTATNGIAVTDTLPANFSITGESPYVTGGTMNSFTLAETLGDGRNVYTYTIDALANSVTNITYNGSFTSIPSNGQYVSSIGITPPSGFNDNNLNDNHATDTVKIRAVASMIDITGTTELCYGTKATLTASAPPEITNPVYKWYDSQTAEAVQINQIFGIDAGEGTWSYFSQTTGDVNAYVRVSQSPEYKGAVIMNGKVIYTSAIGCYPYRGMTDSKKVEFTYMPAVGSCLAGKTYKVVIILYKR